MSIDAENFKVPAGKTISLKDYDSSWIPKWAKKQEEKEGKKAVKEQALTLLEANRQKLAELQELFWASNTYSMLIILQGMDAAGKDSTIAHVMSGINPQGCQVTGFQNSLRRGAGSRFPMAIHKSSSGKGQHRNF